MTNFQWRAFIFFIGVIVLAIGAYIVSASIDVYHYLTLNSSVPYETVDYSVKGLSDEDWRVKATYTFTPQNGQKLEGSTLFGQRNRNPFRAEEEIKELKSTVPVVWYNQKNPSNNSLEKYFPTKKVISSLILIGILYYFSSLGYILAKKKDEYADTSEKMR